MKVLRDYCGCGSTEQITAKDPRSKVKGAVMLLPLSAIMAAEEWQTSKSRVYDSGVAFSSGIDLGD